VYLLLSGQTRPVTVKRFLMENTVEERLLRVRRTLQANRRSTSTGICGANLLDAEFSHCGPKGKRSAAEADVSAERVLFLEKVIGTIAVGKP